MMAQREPCLELDCRSKHLTDVIENKNLSNSCNGKDPRHFDSFRSPVMALERVPEWSSSAYTQRQNTSKMAPQNIMKYLVVHVVRSTDLVTPTELLNLVVHKLPTTYFMAHDFRSIYMDSSQLRTTYQMAHGLRLTHIIMLAHEVRTTYLFGPWMTHYVYFGSGLTHTYHMVPISKFYLAWKHRCTEWHQTHLPSLK